MERNGKDKKAKTAVALAYEPGDLAPKILATGKGELAERIIEKGREENVPLQIHSCCPYHCCYDA